MTSQSTVDAEVVLNKKNKSKALSTKNDFQISNDDNPVTAIARIAANGAPTEVIEQMKGLVEWNERRLAKAEFDTAFSCAKQKFKEALKSGENKHIGVRYSMLEDYDVATKDALSEYGLSWRHVPTTLPGNVLSIKCILAHKGGHREEAEMQAPAHCAMNKMVNELQSTGIVAAYLKRITMCSMLGLVSDSEFDNDGNGGESRAQVQQPQARTVQEFASDVKERFGPGVSVTTKTDGETVVSGGLLPSAPKPIQAGALKVIRMSIKNRGITETDVCSHFKVANLELLGMSQANAVLDFVRAAK